VIRPIAFLLIILVLVIGFCLLLMNKKKEINLRWEKKLGGVSQGQVSLLTLYDNYQFDKNLKADWGFSVLVATRTHKILFDTGADPEILLFNMEKLKVKIEEIDFVFISHLHQDHTGGLKGILRKKPELKVYRPDSFAGPQRIVDGVWTTGPLGEGVREQSLILETKKGLIIITGCAHPGLVTIVKKAKEIFPQKGVYLVLGGFHLFEASDFQLKEIVREFRQFKVEKVAPCHCSGDRCREVFRQEYREDFVENGVGRRVEGGEES